MIFSGPFNLNEDEWKAFMAKIDNPPEPTLELTQLFKEYAQYTLAKHTEE